MANENAVFFDIPCRCLRAEMETEFARNVLACFVEEAFAPRPIRCCAFSASTAVVAMVGRAWAPRFYYI
jgi:hypothetical protein